MSFTLANFNFEGKTLHVFGTPDKPMFLAKEVGELLGLINYNECVRTFDEDEKGIERIDTIGGKQKMTVISKNALKKLMRRTRKKIPGEFLEFLKQYDISMDVIVPCVESESIHIIKATFLDLRSETQYRLGNYRLDLCFPEQRIAIECDEYNHKNYDQEKEIERELYIKNQGFELIRYNPNEPNFNIGTVLYQIRLKASKEGTK